MPIAATSTVSLAERFHEMYGSEPLIFRAPGRVNLIGEHTDMARRPTSRLLDKSQISTQGLCETPVSFPYLQYFTDY
jgi:Galactokinase galactose-binding signature